MASTKQEKGLRSFINSYFPAVHSIPSRNGRSQRNSRLLKSRGCVDDSSVKIQLYYYMFAPRATSNCHVLPSFQPSDEFFNCVPVVNSAPRKHSPSDSRCPLPSSLIRRCMPLGPTHLGAPQPTLFPSTYYESTGDDPGLI